MSSAPFVEHAHAKCVIIIEFLVQLRIKDKKVKHISLTSCGMVRPAVVRVNPDQRSSLIFCSNSVGGRVATSMSLSTKSMTSERSPDALHTILAVKSIRGPVDPWVGGSSWCWHGEVLVKSADDVDLGHLPATRRALCMHQVALGGAYLSVTVCCWLNRSRGIPHCVQVMCSEMNP